MMSPHAFRSLLGPGLAQLSLVLGPQAVTYTSVHSVAVPQVAKHEVPD